MAVKQSGFVSSGTQPSSAERQSCKPTAYLIGNQPVPPSSLQVFLLVRAGFAFKDVKAMVSSSVLYSSADILARVVGGAIRTAHRKALESGKARLNAQQSAVAFQYARALEDAIVVFGSQPQAEAWLGRPCRHLEDCVPLDMVENTVGFQVVESYLQRVEMGVYQ
ncbi:antitoxin Xre/MbcA/ParS toxin-binding domain-containing protein [Pseudomonas sp. WHRI 8519]|uniref:antitoxin Xre/MbcA/ParS toxin-binding domain-containing protein n=1 Tax=Pseudomonas sp. WHRI 8519 TaxID=3162567 RepID=UPI0032EFD565